MKHEQKVTENTVHVPSASCAFRKTRIDAEANFIAQTIPKNVFYDASEMTIFVASCDNNEVKLCSSSFRRLEPERNAFHCFLTQNSISLFFFAILLLKLCESHGCVIKGIIIVLA